jgi:hypothetical protein
MTKHLHRKLLCALSSPRNPRRIFSRSVRDRGVGHNSENAMRYTSPGFRSVEACSNRAAAVIFAERAARKHYGRSGYCRTCTQVARSEGGTFAEYSASIAYTLRGQSSGTAKLKKSFVVYARDL